MLFGRMIKVVSDDDYDKVLWFQTIFWYLFLGINKKLNRLPYKICKKLRIM